MLSDHQLPNAAILMTALALLPLAVYGDRPGQEIEFPMAVVILGGLLTSTLLSLFVLPALYLWIGTARRHPEPSLGAARPDVSSRAR